MKYKALQRFGCMALGAAILSFGLFNIHSQSRITEGGVLGATLLLQHWLRLSPAVTQPVLDGLFYLLGLKFLGRGFLKNAVFTTGCYALFYAGWERVGYLLPNLGPVPLLAAVAGGCFVGVGVGLVVRAGGASGGDDALALVLSKCFGWPLERCFLITDLTVLTLSLSYIPLHKIACSLVTVMLSSWTIGRIQKL